MIKNRRWAAPAAFIMLFLLFAAIIVWLMFGEQTSSGRSSAGISVVLYGVGSERWRSLDQGISQACAEQGVEKPVLTVSGAQDAQSQLELLQREVANGARGLLVAAADSEEIRVCLQQLAGDIPVVLLESGVEGQPCISADNGAMGTELAEEMAAQGKRLLVLEENMQRKSVADCYEAFVERALQLGAELAIVRRQEQDPPFPVFLARLSELKRADAVVALDNETLETVSDVVAALELETEVYGVGGSEKVLHALDKGTVTGICFQNEYAVGYIAANNLFAAMGLGKQAQFGPVEHHYVNRETMYLPEVEKLIFPIMQ